MALLSRNGHVEEVNPNTIGMSKDLCVRCARNVATWMGEEVTVYKSKNSQRFYFRLSGDRRPRIKRDSVIWESIV